MKNSIDAFILTQLQIEPNSRNQREVEMILKLEKDYRGDLWKQKYDAHLNGKRFMRDERMTFSKAVEKLRDMIVSGAGSGTNYSTIEVVVTKTGKNMCWQFDLPAAEYMKEQ